VRRRSAFTLVEILISIAVIGVLLGMVFLGFGHVRRGVDENATRTTIETLKGLVAEYRAVGGSDDALESTYLLNPAVPPAPPDVPATPPDFPRDYQIVAPKRSVSEGAPAADRDCPAVVKTRRVMARLMAVPANRAVVDALPTEQKWTTAAGVVLLDAHHNPVLYVPRNGITVVQFGLKSDGTYEEFDRAVYTHQSPRRGFWVSAGPDGRYDTGDDNTWSIQPEK